MDEIQAKAVAEILGGQPWQSGGGIWLAVKERSDGKLVVISDEVVCEYESEKSFEDVNPSQTILLC